MERIVCQFSCGAASAVAVKLVLSEFTPEQVVIVNAFVKEEHKDNRRFHVDCERWFNHPTLTLRDEKYGASTLEVWRRERYIKGPNGAPCSRALKRRVLAQMERADDIKVIGFTAEEQDRADTLQDNFPSESFRFPLIEHGLSRSDCYAMIDRAGIRIPEMYHLGYDNANCIGCPKGGQAYWQNIRADFPERFAEIQAIQEEIGPGADFLMFRSGPRKGERMPLRELPQGRGDMREEPDFTCSFFCEMATRGMTFVGASA